MASNQAHNIITINGLPGSGKSTAAKSVAKELGYEYFSVGSLIRKLAEEQGKELLEFSKEADENSDIHKVLDDKMLEYVRSHDKVVVDGRIAAWILDKEGIKAFNIWMGASLEVRADRIANRDNRDAKEAYKRTQEREKCEYLRYKKIYSIDMMDLSVYDLVVNTEESGSKEVLKIILRAFKKNN